MTTSFDNIESFSYTEGWRKEFHKIADVELVVEGSVLVAHSQFLCQSEIFSGAILDTTNEGGGKVRIEAVFAGVTVKELDSFLAHLYGVPKTVYPGELGESQKVINVAIKCGFDGVAKRVLNNLTKASPGQKGNDLLGAFRAKMGIPFIRTEINLTIIQEWVKIYNVMPHHGLEDALSEFLAENYSLLTDTNVGFGDFPGDQLVELQNMVTVNNRLMKKILDLVCSTLKDLWLRCHLTCGFSGAIELDIDSGDL
ncbi:hypothetical protein BSKO_09562 [Bryopsis sp. KO-2023]|nr:hypothetical protein BSKO_09562 [Bryopsis sp. KO-2023]